ncbi:MAG: N-acetylneuraminate synthase family protein [Bacteroidetes bacterium]|nr:N-acetylneuraminate synthase family protein [Bacteroidota bacterium]
MTISIGENNINPDSDRIFIVFEGGPTHDGIETAKRLIDVAVDSKADAVKFQMIDADRLMGEKDVKFGYKILADRENDIYAGREEMLYDILKRRELKKEEWKELKEYADMKGIMFFCTVMFPDEVDFAVDELGIQSLKVASADVDHFPLLRYISGKNVNIQVDTGSGNLWEIERAVRIIRERNNNIIIHHCPSGYPARLESINLRVIPTLKMMFPEHVIAFSDHTPGWDMDVAAIALGARLVEKTITLDRTTPSVEHCFSLEPDDAKRFVKSVRELETALGSSTRDIPSNILEERKKGRRSVFIKKSLSKGSALKPDNLDYKRPGYGISPSQSDILIGRTVAKDLPDNYMLSWKDII